MDSRVNIEIYKLDSQEDNSPLGLLKIAQKCILKSETNLKPKYEFQKGDEVWIVLDVDMDKTASRTPQIKVLKEFCSKNENWFIAQSNPCFEVWLHYHHFEKMQNLENSSKCSNWKAFVNNTFNGGFDSRRHPIFIQKATENAKNNYQVINNELIEGCTEVYLLGQSILPILKDKIDKVLDSLNQK